MLAGDYSVFEKTSRERLRNQLSKIEAQDKHRKHVQARRMTANLMKCDKARTFFMPLSSCAASLCFGAIAS